MNSISLLSNIAAVLYLFLGINTFRLDRKSNVNRFFFLVCLSMALWAFSAVFAFSADTKKNFMFWFHLGSMFNIIFYPLTLHFCLALTKLIALRPLVYAVIYAPTIPIFYHASTGNILFKDFVKVGNYWEFLPDYGSPWLVYVALYYFTCMMTGAVCFIIWSRRAITNKERKQGKIIAHAMLISIIIVTVDEIFLSKLDFYNTKAISPILFIIWMVGIWYAIARYQFLKITPAVVSECIVANIDESFVLLDNDMKILRVNQSTERMLNAPRKILYGRNFFEIIEEGQRVQEEMERMRKREFESISCRVHYKVTDGHSLLIDARLKIVRDRHDDVIGVLVMGKEVLGVKRFRERFHVTPREADVVKLIVQGLSRKEIARCMCLSEETVKTHTTSAYNKLGINNKMQLVDLLKEYDLIPEHSADRTVVLL